MEKRETLDAICERIKALDGEVCALRVQNKRLRVVIAALVFLAVLPYLLAAGMQTQTFKTLRVERIEFVQDDRVVAVIRGRVTPGVGDSLGICDKDGIPIGIFSSVTEGDLAGSNMLALYSKRGKAVITLTSTPDENGAVFIANNRGKPVVCLGVANKPGVMSYGSGSLFINDKDGRGMISLLLDPENGGGKLQIFRAPHQGDTTTAAVTLSIWENGSGLIIITNSSGSPIWTTPLR